MKAELKAAIESDERIASVWPNVVLAGYVGSIAHGTAGDVIDDIDVYGVFVGDDRHYYGLNQVDTIHKVGVAEHYDFTLFEIGKYVRLLLKANPNVISLLWLPQNLYVVRESVGSALLAARQAFMTKLLYKSFGGYAHAQLQKMTRGSTESAYQGAKRRERYEKFGYDCKNAAHLIRLLRMGVEALTSGEILVQRHDAAQLREIKMGGWTLDQVREEAERLNHLLDEAFVRSDLPDRPDRDAVERVLVGMVTHCFEARRLAAGLVT